MLQMIVMMTAMKNRWKCNCLIKQKHISSGVFKNVVDEDSGTNDDEDDSSTNDDEDDSSTNDDEDDDGSMKI